MRSTNTIIDVPLGEMRDGVFVPNGQTVLVTIVDIYSKTGKVFLRKADGAMLSNHITLGTDDVAENYEEIEK